MLKSTQHLCDNYLPNCWVDLSFNLTLIVGFFLFWRKNMLTVTLEFNIKSTQNLSRYIFFRRRLVHVQWDWKYAVNFFTLYQVLEMKLTSSKTLEKSKGATPEIKIKTLIKFWVTIMCSNDDLTWVATNHFVDLDLFTFLFSDKVLLGECEENIFWEGFG